MVRFMVLDIDVSDVCLPVSEHNEHPDERFGEAFESRITDEQYQRTKYSTCRATIYGRGAPTAEFPNGPSVAVHVRDFRPSLLVAASTPLADLSERPQLLKTSFHTAARFDAWNPDPATRTAQLERFKRVFFPTRRDWHAAREQTTVEILEGMVELSTQLQDMTGIVPGGWVNVSNTRPCQTCNVDVDIECCLADLAPVADNSEMAPMVVATYDIECVSPQHKFPDSSIDDNAIACIGVVLSREPDDANAPALARVLFIDTSHNRPVNDIEDASVRRFSSEHDMLRAFRDYIVGEVNADVLMTYNGLGFDDEYLWRRAEKVGAVSFAYLTRARMERCRARSTNSTSNQSGSRSKFLLGATGRVSVDVILWMFSNRNLPSYKLDDVAELDLKSRKVDLAAEFGSVGESPYRVLNRILLGNDPALRARAGYYCLCDCDLTRRLAAHNCIVSQHVATAQITRTLMSRVITGGEGQKTRNKVVLLMHRASPMRVLPKIKAEKINGKYEGATVLEPEVGFYRLITVLDFASLYPSIMIHHNLCITTFVNNPDITTRVLAVLSESNVSGHIFRVHAGAEMCEVAGDDTLKIQVRTTALADLDGVVFNVILAPPSPAIFVYSEPGVTPSMLQEWSIERKRIKRLMANATDKGLQRVLDGQQKAVKVSMNAVYGQSGASFGHLPCLSLARATTFIGRCMIQRAKSICEKHDPSCKVIYGDTDSVFLNFDVDDETNQPTNQPTLEEASARGTKLAVKCTEHFNQDRPGNAGPIKLENEKSYHPFLIMGKKRYTGQMFEDVQGTLTHTKTDFKGMARVRRDVADVAKNIQKEMNECLLKHKDPDRALLILREKLDDIVNDRVPHAQYELSAKMAEKYADDDIAHVAVNKELRRLGREAALVGDRQPYIICRLKNATKTFQMAKCPIYAREQGYAINRMYYITNQVANPIRDLMAWRKAAVDKEINDAVAHLNASPQWQAAGGQSTLTGQLSSVDEPAFDMRSLLPPVKKRVKKK